MSNPTILCIVGDSRSGSTLLQYLLGMQPDVATVGELRRLGQLLAEGRPCSCG
ncbi:MAG: sulfotransferase, partial [Alphaproteobacteria bacterium]|nr:sulfotransferase [Alphaproteobacteria bacterium]